MLRNFIRSSINQQGLKLDEWLENSRCVLCGSAAATNPWCERCASDLPKWTEPSLVLPGLDEVTVGYCYVFPLDRLIQIAKYRSNFMLASALATLMPNPVTQSVPTVIYPVPVSKWRLYRRGFNQTRILADTIKSRIGCTLDEVSIHKRNWRKDQSSLDASARKRNARDLFYADFGVKRRHHAVIVDDVITTGATLSALALILRKHGAERVDAVALSAVR